MNYVLTENGNIKIGPNGKPVVLDGEKEIEIDAIGANEKIQTLTAESNDRRKKLSEATTKLEEASGVNTTLQTQVDAIDDKNKVKIDELKSEINKAWEVKQGDWEKDKATLNDQLFDATTGTKFATSKVIAGTVLPPDIAKATFGKHFNPDGSANDTAGNPIFSQERPGEPADFDEAMTRILDAYPGKDAIMKSTASGGSGGAHSGDGGSGGEAKTSLNKISDGLKAM